MTKLEIAIANALLALIAAQRDQDAAATEKVLFTSTRRRLSVAEKELTEALND